MERFGFVDLKPSRPGAVRYVHESDTKQLVVVIPGPVEHHTRARQSGDIALGICCALWYMLYKTVFIT